jgi:tRNA pseudouridine38-40 synthase
MRIALKFAYDGSVFHGYARQPNLKTVEGEIIEKITKNNIIDNLETCRFRATSRTDKGVSATGNVIAFYTEHFEKKMIDILNKENDCMLFYGYKTVDDDFYPRYARLRQYRYYLDVKNLDTEKIIRALSFFTGEHDFSNFARIEQGKNPVKTIDNIIYFFDDDFLIIDFFAQTFLWNQIRRIISAVEKIGSGKIKEQEIIDALNNPGKIVDLRVAPPEPLILKDVFYGFEFENYTKYFKKLNELENKIVSNIKKR